jgi:predicted component of type VI protein secretion system
MKTRTPRFALLAALGLLGALVSGCSTASAVRVRPWERAALADPAMNPDRDPLADGMADHINFAREAANGGKGVGGSGCGCN